MKISTIPFLLKSKFVSKHLLVYRYVRLIQIYLCRPVDLDIPYKTRRNGTMFAHIFVSSKFSGDYVKLINDRETVHVTTALTKYYIPDVVKVQLLSNSSFVNMTSVKPVSHIKKILPFIMLTDDVTLVRTELPEDIYRYLK